MTGSGEAARPNESPVALSSEHVTLHVARTGAVRLLDRRTGIAWGAPPFQEGRPGVVEFKDSAGQTHVAELDGGSADLELLGSFGARVRFSRAVSPAFGEVPVTVSALVGIKPSGDGFGIDVEEVRIPEAFRFESICYPLHFAALQTAVDDGELALPARQGVLFPTRLQAGFMRYMHNIWRKIADQRRRLSFESTGLNMPWFGLTRRMDGRIDGLMVDVLRPEDAALDVVGNCFVGEVKRFGPQGEPREVGVGARILAASLVWRSSHGRLAYRRSAVYTSIPNGNYVTFAHRYRERAKALGRYRSLKEKIEQNPLVERLIGAPDIKIWICSHRPFEPSIRSYPQPVLDGYHRVNTTFDQVAEIVRDVAEGLRLERALIFLGGWAKDGFDYARPDIWPPCPDAGGTPALRRAAELANSYGYLFALEDNYQDLYRRAPQFDERRVQRSADGRLQEGGIWDGGICYLSCSSQPFDLVKRNLDLVREHVNPTSYYFDTTTATPLYECYAPEHPLTRADDRTNKLELIRAAKRYGWVVGVESGSDYANAEASYYEGTPGAAVGYWEGVASTDFGIAVPLWSLVYHDSVVCYWQHGMPYGREDHANHVLSDLLWGYPSSWSLDAEQWPGMRDLVLQTYNLLGRLHRQTAHDQLIDHRFLTPDYLVQESKFGEGTEVLVNSALTTKELPDGRRIDARSFVVDSPALGKVRGVVERGYRLAEA